MKKKMFFITGTIVVVTIAILIKFFYRLYEERTAVNLLNEFISDSLPNIFLKREKLVGSTNKIITSQEVAFYFDAWDRRKKFIYELKISDNKIVINFIESPFFLSRQSLALDTIDLLSEEWKCSGYFYIGKPVKPCSPEYIFVFKDGKLTFKKNNL